MKRKLLLTLVMIVAGIIMANAQCTPGNYTSAGIYPDTLINLPKAYVNYHYATAITCVIPADTVYMGMPMTIDSIDITSFTGLPTGFISSPNPATGHFKGGTKGCVLITGTATTGQEGVYRLAIEKEAYVSGLTQTTPVNGYKINIVDSVTGINEINAQNAISLNAYSDASNNSIVVKINSSSPVKDASIFVNDITGRELMRLENVNGNEIIMNRGSLSSGIYIVSLRNNEKVIAREKIFVE